MPDKDASEKAADYVRELMVEKDSSGGTIECVVDGLKAGFGEPVFDKLDANLAKAIFSIGAVKGFEIGDGFKAAESRGSENNDEFISENGNVTKSTNHSGGILGGISDNGSQLYSERHLNLHHLLQESRRQWIIQEMKQKLKFTEDMIL